MEHRVYSVVGASCVAVQQGRGSDADVARGGRPHRLLGHCQSREWVSDVVCSVLQYIVYSTWRIVYSTLCIVCSMLYTSCVI